MSIKQNDNRRCRDIYIGSWLSFLSILLDSTNLFKVLYKQESSFYTYSIGLGLLGVNLR